MTGPDAQDLSGTVLLEKLKVIRKLGGGGMGAVYEVEHLLTGHRRALKVVAPRYTARPNFARRLIREASVAGRLQTPYVVETYDAGMLEDGSAYVLMELLEGRSLLDLMQSEIEVEVPHLAGIACQVCEGVTLAHRAGIVHRDLKPENIFLVADPGGGERVKILDFGISHYKEGTEEGPSKLTAEGTVLGTPFYMSPEQAAAKPIDERTDVYAIGVIMYEALTGRLPFESKSVGALFIKIHAGEYLPVRHWVPEIDPAFEEIVHRAMHRDAEQRYQTAEALRQALLPFAQSPVKARAKTLADGQRSATPSGNARVDRDSATMAAEATAPASEPPKRGSGSGPQQKLPSTPPAKIPSARAGALPAPPAKQSSPLVLWIGAGIVATGLVIAGVAIQSAEDGLDEEPGPVAAAGQPPREPVEEPRAEEPAPRIAQAQAPVVGATPDAGPAVAVQQTREGGGRQRARGGQGEGQPRRGQTAAEKAGLLGNNPYQ